VSWIRDTVTPASLTEASQVLGGDNGGLQWMPRGGGTLLGRGARPREPVFAFDLSKCGRVIEHAYDELTVTVEAGISMASLQHTLAEHGQWLPLSIHPDPRSTIGGWIAADKRTPLAGNWGSVRDYLLGIAWMDGRGRTLRAGGRVVKNVAGYDLMKLHTGALGELGVIVEATFKVLPSPAEWGAVTVASPDATVPRRALEGAPQLFPAGLWRYDIGYGERLALVFAGSRTRVNAQMNRAQVLLGSTADTLDSTGTLTLVAELERGTRPESSCVAWGGALPEWLTGERLGVGSHWCVDLLHGHFWSRWDGDESALARARSALRAGEGHMHLDACSDEPLVNPWGWRSEGAELLSGLKGALDPERRYVEGRWPAH